MIGIEKLMYGLKQCGLRCGSECLRTEICQTNSIELFYSYIKYFSNVYETDFRRKVLLWPHIRQVGKSEFAYSV
jgi:hypothetical protein